MATTVNGVAIVLDVLAKFAPSSAPLFPFFFAFLPLSFAALPFGAAPSRSDGEACVFGCLISFGPFAAPSNLSAAALLPSSPPLPTSRNSGSGSGTGAAVVGVAVVGAPVVDAAVMGALVVGAAVTADSVVTASGGSPAVSCASLQKSGPAYAWPLMPSVADSGRLPAVTVLATPYRLATTSPLTPPTDARTTTDENGASTDAEKGSPPTVWSRATSSNVLKMTIVELPSSPTVPKSSAVKRPP
mmetsp:Transcript_7587/g.19575  ORF Transcript_7587/g.19575 Transcript_7587/m.19575 type:complete len:244 (-) Transcript_7587:415-1146(-)